MTGFASSFFSPSFLFPLLIKVSFSAHKFSHFCFSYSLPHPARDKDWSGSCVLPCCWPGSIHHKLHWRVFNCLYIKEAISYYLSSSTSCVLVCAQYSFLSSFIIIFIPSVCWNLILNSTHPANLSSAKAVRKQRLWEWIQSFNSVAIV